jgi:hypothetical protein
MREQEKVALRKVGWRGRMEQLISLTENKTSRTFFVLHYKQS